MDKQSTLYQLMGMRMNGIMNGIMEQDEDYFHMPPDFVETCICGWHFFPHGLAGRSVYPLFPNKDTNRHTDGHKG